jgi:hypothetical protein
VISTGAALIQVLQEDHAIGQALLSSHENQERAQSSLLSLATILTGVAAAGAIAAFLIQQFLSDESEDVPADVDDLKTEGETATAEISELEEETEKQVTATINGLEVPEPETAKATPVPSQHQEGDTSNEPEKETKGETGFWSKMKDWFQGGQQRPGKPGSVQDPGTQTGSGPGSGSTLQRRAGTARPSAEIDRILRQKSTADVGYDELYSLAGVESTFRSDVGASTSKAQGLFQFLPDTWNYLLKLNPGLGFTLEDRMDPEKATVMAVIYIRMIKAKLKKALGRDPYLVDVYMAYFLGPTAAVNFFKAMKDDKSQIGASLFARAAKSNPGVFYTKGKALTLGQIYEKLGGRLYVYYADARHNTEQALGLGSGAGSASSSTQAQPAAKVSGSIELAPRDVVQKISPVNIAVGEVGQPEQGAAKVSGQSSAVDTRSVTDAAPGIASRIGEHRIPVATAVPEPKAATRPEADVTATNNVKVQTRLPVERPTTADSQTPDQSAQYIPASDETGAQHGTLIRRGRAIYRLEQG